MSADYQNLNTILIQTLRKKIEALRESEEKFKNIFDNASDGILLSDAVTTNFFAANKTICRMLGYSEDELKRLNVKAIHLKKDLPYVLNQFEKLVKREITLAKDIPVRRKDGSVFYAEISSTPTKFGGKTYLAGIFRDITERRKAGEALRDAEEKWTSLTRNTNDVIMIVDGKGIIYYINKTYPPYTPEETVGNSMYKYTLKEQHKIMKDSLERVFKTGKPVSYEISSDIPKTGIVAFSTKVVPIKKGKKVVKAILLSTDITERKKVEEAQRAAEEKYRTIVENATDSIFLLDTNLRFISLNKAAENMLHKLASELIGKSISVAFPKFIAVKFIRNNKEVIRTGKGKFIEEKMVVSGREFYISTSLNPIKNSEGKVIAVMGITRNITERKKAEDKLKETREKYKEEINELKRKLKARRKL
jgi:PAS domain S-box-containing protein